MRFFCKWGLLSFREEGVAEAEGLGEGGDVVHAVQIGAVSGGQQAEGYGGQGIQDGSGGAGEDVADEALAGQGGEDGAVADAELLQVAQEGEVVLGGFAESESGVQADAGGGDAGGFCCGHAFFKKGAYFCHDIVVLRVLLHGGGRALHVHEDDAAGGVLRAELQHGGVGEAGDVVDDVDAGLQGCGSGFRSAGVDGEQGLRVAGAQGCYQGDSAAYFFLRRGGGGAGAGGFPADVDDVCAFLQQFIGMGQRGVQGVVLPAVGEGIRRGVQDTDDGGGEKQN